MLATREIMLATREHVANMLATREHVGNIVSMLPTCWQHVSKILNFSAISRAMDKVSTDLSGCCTRKDKLAVQLEILSLEDSCYAFDLITIMGIGPCSLLCFLGTLCSPFDFTMILELLYHHLRLCFLPTIHNNLRDELTPSLLQRFL